MSVLNRVRQIASEQSCIDISMINESTEFLGNNPANTLNFDSLDCVEFVMELEDELDLSIPDEECEKWKNISDAVKYIEDHKPELVAKESTPNLPKTE